MKKFSSPTKANSQPRSAIKSRLRLAAVGVALIMLGLLFPAFFSAVGGTLLYPFHAVAVWFRESESVIPYFFRERTALYDEIEQLTSQVAEQEGAVRSVERLIDENIALRAMLNDQPGTRTAARVVARPGTLPYDIVQIDKGSDHGIVRGAPVFHGRDTVIGIVAHAAPQFSFVELFSTAGSEATVFVLGPNVFATMEGVGAGISRVRLPQGIRFSVGDLVILTAVDSGVYGEIIHTESVPTQPEQYGYVSTSVPLQGLRFVSVGQAPIGPQAVPDPAALIAEFSRVSLVQPEAPTSTPTTTPSVTP